MFRTIRAGALVVAITALSVVPAGATHGTPVITSPAEGSFVNTGIVTIAGTAPGDAVSVRVFEGATVLGDTGVVGGAWSVDIPLGDGTHTVRAAARDGVGSFSALSPAVAFIVDTVRPAPPLIVSPADGALYAFSEITVEGTAEPFATIEISVNTGATASTVARGDGTWSYARTFSNATHSLSARAIDTAGSRSNPSAPVTFTIDTLAPAAPRIDSPGEGSSTRDSSVVVAGAAEPGSSVTIYSSVPLATVVAAGGGAWHAALTFPDGTHRIYARATDAAGNVSSSSPIRTFTVDGTAPAAPSIHTPGPGAQVSPVNLVVTGSGEPNATIELMRGSLVVASRPIASDGLWSLPLSGVADGPVTVTLRVRDRAGNVGPDASRSFVVDGTPPTIEITTANGAIFTPANPPRIVGSASDAHSVASVTLDFYDITGRGIYSSRATCTACPNGTMVWWEGTDTPLIGRFIVRASAMDKAGNRSLFDEIAVTIVRAS